MLQGNIFYKMKLNSLQESIDDYERITGEIVDIDKFEWDDSKGYVDKSSNKYLKILPSNEWLIWSIKEIDGVRFLWVDQTYGFIKNFVSFLQEALELNNIEWMVTATTRNPKAHIRKWKMESLPDYNYEYEGRFYYVLKTHKSNLK